MTAQTITPQATSATSPAIADASCPTPDFHALLGCGLDFTEPTDDRASIYVSPELIAQMAARRSETGA